ncbi:MAG: IS630 family transposase [Planctomycetia bacterium]|nr:IS630 family transposase [Planctomycetia bacterium]
MVALKVSSKQWDALDALRFSTREAKVFRNATIILLTSAGNSKPAIAYELGCSVSTVDNVRRNYRHHGLKGLLPKKSPGRASRATAEYREALRAVVQTPPQSLGYGFSVWSLARLAAHLKRKTGVSLSDDQLGRVLRAEGFSHQRPKHTLKGQRNEVAYERARRALKTLKKRPSNRMLTRC